MNITSDNPEHGFQFPGEFEITAMGAVDDELHTVLPALLVAAGVTLADTDVTTRESSGGKYVAVRLRIYARDRAEYETAHETVRAHPAVKWTL